MTTSSLVSFPVGRVCCSISRSAFIELGLFVTMASLVSPLPSSMATRKKDATIATIQATIVRHGWAAAARARRSVMRPL